MYSIWSTRLKCFSHCKHCFQIWAFSRPIFDMILVIYDVESEKIFKESSCLGIKEGEYLKATDAYFKFHKQYKHQSSIRKRLSAVCGGTPLLDRGGISAAELKPLPSFTSSAMASVFVRSVSTQWKPISFPPARLIW